MVALIDGAEKHSIGSWTAIREDNMLLLQARTPTQLQQKWNWLVRQCSVEGMNMGGGRIRRYETTLPESKWTLVAQLSKDLPNSSRMEEAEVIALVDGVQKHGVGRWTAIQQDNSRVLQKRTPMDLACKWLQLVQASGTTGSDAGNGRIRCRGTTLPKKKWALIAKLKKRKKDAEGTTLHGSNWELVDKSSDATLVNLRNLHSMPMSEAEVISLIKGVEKHGTSCWETIREDNQHSLHTLVTLQPAQLRDKWRSLKRDCGMKGEGMGNGRIRRGRTTLPERMWTLIAKLSNTKEAELIALVDGVQKHGIGRWTAIKRDNPHLLQRRTPGDLACTWIQLVKACGARRYGTTLVLPKEKWALVAELKKEKKGAEGTTLHGSNWELVDKGSDDAIKENMRSVPMSEAEVISLIKGVEKHGTSCWKTIREDNLHRMHTLETRTPTQLRNKWKSLKRACGMKGKDMGNGRIRRVRTTLPERMWTLIAKLEDLASPPG